MSQNREIVEISALTTKAALGLFLKVAPSLTHADQTKLEAAVEVAEKYLP